MVGWKVAVGSGVIVNVAVGGKTVGTAETGVAVALMTRFVVEHANPNRIKRNSNRFTTNLLK